MPKYWKITFLIKKESLMLKKNPITCLIHDSCLKTLFHF